MSHIPSPPGLPLGVFGEFTPNSGFCWAMRGSTRNKFILEPICLMVWGVNYLESLTLDLVLALVPFQDGGSGFVK